MNCTGMSRRRRRLGCDRSCALVKESHQMPIDEEWFEKCWEHREEVIYPKLFGVEFEGIYPIPHDRLAKGQVGDPRWSTCGVFRYKPTASRSSWLYVSSGLSNDWLATTPNPGGTSGLGSEYVMETTDCFEWPTQRLHQIMVYQIGLCTGIYPGADVLNVGHRIPLGSPVDFKTSDLSRLVVVEPVSFDPEFHQASGSAFFDQLIGITESETEFAQEFGHQALIDKLKTYTEYPITDPTRSSVI